MTSLAPSASVASFFPSPPPLAHSLNSRGELGMFVNPYACSCVTCVDYVAARSAPEVSLLPEEPAPAPAAVPAPRLPSLTRSLTLGMGASLAPSASYAPAPAASGFFPLPRPDSLFGAALGLSALPTPTPASLTRSVTGFVEGWGGEERPAPALARTVTGLGHAPTLAESEHESDEEDGDGAAAAAPAYNGAVLPGLGLCSAEEESLLLRLSTLRLQLKQRQDAVYDGVVRSHDEMAAQDAEWDELDRKIDAMGMLLRSYGVVLRDE